MIESENICLCFFWKFSQSRVYSAAAHLCLQWWSSPAARPWCSSRQSTCDSADTCHFPGLVYVKEDVTEQCRRKTCMVHQTFVWWALYIPYKFVKSSIRHFSLAFGNVRCVRRFSLTLYRDATINSLAPGKPRCRFKMQFSISFYWLVSSHHLRIMPWDECQGISLMINQHGFR